MATADWDVAIVGGGPSGLSAALMLGRAGRRVIVIDSGEPRNRFSEHMHGMLGADGMPPTEFLAQAKAQVEAYDVQFQTDVVVRVDDAGECIRVTTESGAELLARRLIAASGAWDGLPDIPGVGERWGRDVLHCPYCHGWEVRGRTFGVLATSSASIHQAELVQQWSDNVTFFTSRLDELSPDARSRFAARNVVLDSRTVTALVIDDDALVGVRVEGSAEVVPCQALFTVPRLSANDAWLDPLGVEREGSMVGGFVRVDDSMRTSHPRVWSVGNVAAPTGTVSYVISAGAKAGGSVNSDLVAEEFDAAATKAGTPPPPAG